MDIELKEVKKPDRRVVKTKRAIRSAFAELLSQKNINEITIKDIADKADVNRKTVYNYYNGIHEILDEIEDMIVEAYEKILKGIDMKQDLENPYRIFKSLTDVISGNLDFYGKLLKIDSNTQLMKKIVSSLVHMAKAELVEKEVFEEENADFIVSFMVSGLLSAYQSWFNSGRKEPIDLFSKKVAALVLNGIKPYLKTDFIL